MSNLDKRKPSVRPSRAERKSVKLHRRGIVKDTQAIGNRRAHERTEIFWMITVIASIVAAISIGLFAFDV